MDRREFLEWLARLGVAAGTAWLSGGAAPLLAQAAAPSRPDLVAVKNGKPEDMFDRAVAALGGMARFVRKGGTVVVKPNIAWDRPPEACATTNPALVARIVKRCLEAGASKVYVFDNTCDEWSACYRDSMIEKYAKDAGAVVAPGSSRGYYQAAVIPGAVTLRNAMFHELVIESDSFINVPVLKSHGGAGMTAAMKNLMGIVWDRGTFHASGLDSCIADSCLFRKPDLNVVDAYNVMLTQGPRGNSAASYRAEKMLIASPDIVAIDAASAKVMGKDPFACRYIGMGNDRGAGTEDLERLRIERVTL